MSPETLPRPISSEQPSRPWRRALPQIPETPGVTKAAQEEIDAKVREMITQHQKKEAVRHAEKVNADIDLEVFGGLSENTLASLQFTADLAARYLETAAIEDDFRTHQERTKFREEGKRLYGSAFVKVFEANRFKLATFTGLISRFLLLREMVEKVDVDSQSVFIRFARKKKEREAIPFAAEMAASVREMSQRIGSTVGLADRYAAMTIDEKLRIVDAVSDAARSYLAIITASDAKERQVA